MGYSLRVCNYFIVLVVIPYLYNVGLYRCKQVMHAFIGGFITAMRIYVDGVAQVYAPNPQPTPWFSLAQPVTIANGTRYIVVVAYLSTGAALSLGETVSVH